MTDAVSVEPGSVGTSSEGSECSAVLYPVRLIDKQNDMRYEDYSIKQDGLRKNRHFSSTVLV